MIVFRESCSWGIRGKDKGGNVLVTRDRGRGRIKVVFVKRGRDTILDVIRPRIGRDERAFG